MKVLQILALVGLVCCFSLTIKSQADCRYGLRFFVQDEAGKIIENAKLELASLDSRVKLPAYVKLIRPDGAYLFTSHAGTTARGDYKINIEADGFEIYQLEVNFPTCKIQDFNIKLNSLLNNQEKSILTGSVYDVNGAVIPQSSVTAINEKGEKFKTQTNSDGEYSLELPYNLYDAGNYAFKVAKYEITVEREGFEKSIVKNFKFVPTYKGKMTLDFALDVQVYIFPVEVDTNNNKNKRKNKNK